VWKLGFDFADIVKRDGDFFLKSIERHSSLPMQISTRYLQFGKSAGLGKQIHALGSPKTHPTY
jgi:hypothetical protein